MWDLIPSELLTDRPDAQIEFAQFLLFWIATGLILQWIINWTPDRDE